MLQILNFKDRLEIGYKAEKKVLSILQNKYPLSTRIVGQFADYDIWIPELHKSVEVKYDRRCKDTGNVCIKELDLLRTKADYWCIYTDDIYIWITPNNINKCISDNNYITKNIYNKKVYLITVNDILKYKEAL